MLETKAPGAKGGGIPLKIKRKNDLRALDIIRR
jgi:hypothetical protein